MKKILSIFLAVVMLLAVFTTVPVSAAEIPGDIIADAAKHDINDTANIIAISSGDAFNKIGKSDGYSDTTGKYFYLTQDITVSRNQNLNRSDFKDAVFNGCGHKITLVYTAEIPEAPCALFEGALNNSTIKNLNVESTYTRTAAKAQQVSYALLAKQANNGDVIFEDINVKVDMDITYVDSPSNNTSNKGIGVFLGLAQNGSSMTVNTVTFKNCSVNGSVDVVFNNSEKTQQSKMIGAFVGYAANGNIVMEDCKNNASITVSSVGAMPPTQSRVGGLIGIALQTVTMTNCENNGAINVSGIKTLVHCGGLIGEIYNVTYDSAASSADIINSANNATISVAATDVNKAPTASTVLGGAFAVGGILGYADSCDYIDISNSDNTGNISVSYDNYGVNVGGIFGVFCYGLGNTAVSCSNYGEISAARATGASGDVIENLSSIGMATTADGDSTKSAVTMQNCINNTFGIEAFSAHSITNNTAIKEGCRNATVVFYGHQLSTDYSTAETFEIRFIAVINALDYDYVGFEVKTDVVGKESYENHSRNAYQSLLANTEYGTETIKASDCGGSHFTVFTIDNIPNGTAVKFTVKPYTEINGTRTYGETFEVSVNK